MLRFAHAPVLVVTCALWLAPAALADSAGDNQYQDPFSNVPTQPKKQTKTQQQTPSSGTEGTTTTQSPTPSQAPSASSAPTPDPIAHAASGTLPRTGFPLVPVAAIGAALLAAGLALRRLA